MGIEHDETWLGIPANHRPATHNDLLGLASLESDPKTVASVPGVLGSIVIAEQEVPAQSDSAPPRKNAPLSWKKRLIGWVFVAIPAAGLLGAFASVMIESSIMNRNAHNVVRKDPAHPTSKPIPLPAPSPEPNVPEEDGGTSIVAPPRLDASGGSGSSIPEPTDEAVADMSQSDQQDSSTESLTAQLEKSKESYHAKIDKIKVNVLALLDSKISAVRKKGNSARVEKLTAENVRLRERSE